MKINKILRTVGNKITDCSYLSNIPLKGTTLDNIESQSLISILKNSVEQMILHKDFPIFIFLVFINESNISQIFH